MFERYTERARRVIFFARYEASQYGSPYIETEHLLLGLLREDRQLAKRFLESSDPEPSIRIAIESQTKRGEPIKGSVEVPLTQDSKKVLNLAGEEADRLAQQHIGTEHLLLAMTSMEHCMAGRLLRERGLRTDAIREDLAKTAHSITSGMSRGLEAIELSLNTLHSFLAALKWYDWERLAPFFADAMQFVDAAGKRWRGRSEIEKQFEGLFAPYAKRNVTFLVESADGASDGLVVASVLWENVTVPGEATRTMHRMTVILVPEAQDWKILFIQVTPILTR